LAIYKSSFRNSSSDPLPILIELFASYYWVLWIHYIFWMLTATTPNLVYDLKICSTVLEVVSLLCWLLPLLCRSF
jgi:hypothetical protein